MNKFLSFAVVSLLVVGCATNPPQPPAEKWVELDAGNFTLQTPPDWEYQDQHSIESKTGILSDTKGAVLISDLGRDSNSMSDYDKTDMVHYEILDGKEAKIVIDRKHGIIGMYVKSAKVLNVPRGDEKMEFNLCIVGGDLDSKQMELILKIFRTIKFKK